MKIKAQNRELTGKSVNKLRKQEMVPAVLFGKNVESKNITFKNGEFEKVYRQVGKNVIFEVEIPEEDTVKVLVQDIQRNPLTDRLLHIALYVINMKEKIDVDVPLVLIGESMAVKNNLGFLEHSVESLSVKCLPTNIPSNIEIDISTLENVNDSIHIKDIKLPEDVEFSSDEKLDTVIARIAPPQKEVEEVTPEVAPVEGEAAEGGTPAEGDASGGSEKASE